MTGASDSGKTAVIRSIRWALYSDPLGEEFINPEVGKAQVQLNFSDASQVIRTRGKGENSYQVNGADFKGFGTNVPLEVLLAHGMPKATFGDVETSLNISFQLDAPFMLSETAGASAKILGKLAGTEELDLAAKDVNGDLFKGRQEKNSLEGLIAKTETTIKDYLWVEEAELKLQALEAFAREFKEKSERDLHLVMLADKMVNFKLEHEKLSGYMSKYKNLISGQNKIQALERTADNYLNMITTRKATTLINANIIDNMIIIKGYKKLPKAIEFQENLDKIYFKLPHLQGLDRKFDGNNESSWLQKSILVKMKNIDVGIQMLKKSMAKSMMVVSLKNHKEKAQYVDGRIDGGSLYLKKFDNLKTAQEKLFSTNATLMMLDGLENRSNKFSDVSIKAKRSRDDIETSKGLEESTKQSFTEYLQSLGKCPTCQSDIEDNQIKSIIGG